MAVQPKWTSAERLWSKTVCLSPAYLCLISAPLSHECLFAALKNFECLSRWLYISCGTQSVFLKVPKGQTRSSFANWCLCARSGQFANEKSREHLDTFASRVTLSLSILHSQWLVLTGPISVDWPIARCCFFCCTFVLCFTAYTKANLKSSKTRRKWVSVTCTLRG